MLLRPPLSPQLTFHLIHFAGHLCLGFLMSIRGTSLWASVPLKRSTSHTRFWHRGVIRHALPTAQAPPPAACCHHLSGRLCFFSLEAGTRVLEAARLHPSPFEMAHEVTEFFVEISGGWLTTFMVAVCAVLHRRAGEVQPPAFFMSVTEVLGSRLVVVETSPRIALSEVGLRGSFRALRFQVWWMSTHSIKMWDTAATTSSSIARGSEHILHIQQHRSVPFTTVGRTSRRSIQHQCQAGKKSRGACRPCAR